jgi:hypothetical protein
MALHEQKDKDGRLVAFEIDNFLVSRRRMCRIVSSIPGVRILKMPSAMQRFFGLSPERMSFVSLRWAAKGSQCASLGAIVAAIGLAHSRCNGTSRLR